MKRLRVLIKPTFLYNQLISAYSGKLAKDKSVLSYFPGDEDIKETLCRGIDSQSAVTPTNL